MTAAEDIMLDHSPTLAAALAERHGSPPAFALPALSAEAAAVLETILGHRSQRAYLPVPLPEGALELAVAAAQSAATSSNLQAWSVVAVRDPGIKAQINALSGEQAQIAAAPVLLVWLADLSRLRAAAEGEGSAAEGLDYLESLVIGIVDATLAAQSAVIALEAQGLGTCYIGGIRNAADRVAAILGLPAEVLPLFGLTLGVPDPARPARVKPRLPLAAVLHQDRYDPTRGAASVAPYAEVLHGFQSAEGLPRADWHRIVAQRVATPAALKGRENLTRYLRSLGFGLK